MRIVKHFHIFAGVLLCVLIIFIHLTYNKKVRSQEITEQKVRRIARTLPTLDKVRQNINYSYIVVGTDGWGNDIEMKFLNRETFIVISGGEDNIIDTWDDNVFRVGRIE